jgi:hypothetical protein
VEKQVRRGSKWNKNDALKYRLVSLETLVGLVPAYLHPTFTYAMILSTCVAWLEAGCRHTATLRVQYDPLFY